MSLRNDRNCLRPHESDHARLNQDWADDELEQRVKSLSSDTGVPLPFEVFYACSVNDANEVERALHNAFGDHRINPKREFFELDPERVYPVLKLVGIEDVTPRDSFIDDPEERAALEKEKTKKRPPFKFSFAAVPTVPNCAYIPRRVNNRYCCRRQKN